MFKKTLCILAPSISQDKSKMTNEKSCINIVIDQNDSKQTNLPTSFYKYKPNMHIRMKIFLSNGSSC